MGVCSQGRAGKNYKQHLKEKVANLPVWVEEEREKDEKKGGKISLEVNQV